MKDYESVTSSKSQKRSMRSSIKIGLSNKGVGQFSIATENEHVADFMRHLERHSIARNRTLRYLKIFGELDALGVNFINPNTADMDRYFFSLKSSAYAEWTKITNWKMFKKIVRFFRKDADFSEYVFRRPTKEPEILSMQEIQLMVASCRSFRDKLIILLLYESGARIGEILTLSKKSVLFDDNGAILMVNGKTGSRPIRVVRCTPMLKAYTDSIADKLFQITPERVNMMIRETAARCNIAKRVYPHLFRHTRATHLARYLTEPEMKIYFGWARNSSMPATYVHMSMRDVDEKILEAARLQRPVPQSAKVAPSE